SRNAWRSACPTLDSSRPSSSRRLQSARPELRACSTSAGTDESEEAFGVRLGFGSVAIDWTTQRKIEWRRSGAPGRRAWGFFLRRTSQRNGTVAGKSVVETAGAVEKPKNGFPTAPWTFGPQFPQRRLRLTLSQTQLSFYSPARCMDGGQPGVGAGLRA